MANLLDYLDWRGDLPLSSAPFGEVDNLILAELSFLDFGDVVPPPGTGETVPLSEAAEAYLSRRTDGDSLGVLVPDDIVTMLRKAAASARFAQMRLAGFSDVLNAERAEQFAALGIDCGDGALYLSFRGTDDTLAGWKEDFNIACLPVIPAQEKALAYTLEMASAFPDRTLRLGGHSKGGHLALWSAIRCPREVQDRIERVWSNDGPGFREDLYAEPEYLRLRDRVRLIVPKSSVVGMLLEHPTEYEVVDSDRPVGLLQHNGFTWQVLGGSFVHLASVSPEGRRNDRALREWIRGMDQTQREQFVDGLFRILSASGARTLTELREDGVRASAAMVRTMREMDPETRDAVSRAVAQLVQSSFRVRREDFLQALQQLSQEAEKKAEELSRNVSKARKKAKKPPSEN